MTNTETPPTMAPVKGGVLAYLLVDGAAKAAEFYHRALGAEIAAAQPPDARGRTMHIHLYINGSSLMLSDPFPEHGAEMKIPQGFTMVVQVDDIDGGWKRAIEAGATAVTPPTKMFWGDRFAAFRDPFGVAWGLNEPAR